MLMHVGFVAIVAATPTQASLYAAKDVVAHWTFQEGVPGFTTRDSSRRIRDVSGNDRHGLVFGDPRYSSFALPTRNIGLCFDGDDRVFVPDHPSFALTKSLTLEAFLQLDRLGPGNLNQIVFRGDDRSGLDPWFLAVTSTGNLTFLITNEDGQTGWIRSPDPIPFGQRIHVAATLNHRTGTQKLFVDHVRVAMGKTDIQAMGTLRGLNAGIGIGDRQSSSDQALYGVIDEVRITARALDPTEFLMASARLMNRHLKRVRCVPGAPGQRDLLKDQRRRNWNASRQVSRDNAGDGAPRCHPPWVREIEREGPEASVVETLPVADEHEAGKPDVPLVSTVNSPTSKPSKPIAYACHDP